MYRLLQNQAGRQTLSLIRPGGEGLSSAAFHDGDVGEEAAVHREGVDDGGDGDDVVVEDEGAAGDGDGLGGVLHADFDDQRAHFLLVEAHGLGQQGSPAHGGKYQDGDAKAQFPELGGDGLVVLDEEHGGQKDEGGKCDFGQHGVNLLCGGGGVAFNQHARQDGEQHEQDVLHDEAAHGQVDVHSRVVANEVGREVHDDGDGEQRDDAAQGRQRHGQGDIPLGKHGKDVGRAASRRAGNQHEADEEQRVELEHPADGECQQRQKYQLPHESRDNRPGPLVEKLEIRHSQCQAQLEHQ